MSFGTVLDITEPQKQLWTKQLKEASSELEYIRQQAEPEYIEGLKVEIKT